MSIVWKDCGIDALIYFNTDNAHAEEQFHLLDRWFLQAGSLVRPLFEESTK